MDGPEQQRPSKVNSTTSEEPDPFLDGIWTAEVAVDLLLLLYIFVVVCLIETFKAA